MAKAKKKAPMIAYITRPGHPEVSRLDPHEISATLYGEQAMGTPNIELTFSKDGDENVFVYLTGFPTQTTGKTRLMSAVPLDEVVHAHRAALLSREDITDITAALKGETDLPRERIAELLAKIGTV